MRAFYMTPYDYLILAFYFLFIMGIGFLFRKFSNNVSDYFRGGGTMLWWMCGASTMMGGLSVWSFTGMASKIYEAGLLVLILPVCNFVSNLVVWIVTCRRFRQMRVMTSVEAIRRRYGGVNEQFYVWLQVPTGLLGGAIGLNTLGVFISSVFGTNLLATVVVVGVIVVFVASAGGVWAVVAGDFVQMLIMLLVTSVATFLALRLPEIGGFAGLAHKLPTSHLDWTHLSRPGVVAFWVSAILIQSLFFANDLSQGAARFMSVKDGVHARKAAFMATAISLFFPVLLFVPPLAAVVLFPDIAARFSNLGHPGEAAYVAVCLKVMPHGMLGLLVSGIFAAAMAGMDTGLNRNAGIFVKNFYNRILRPNASDKELLLMSRVFTVCFGALIIGGGVLIALCRNMNLFDLAITIGSLIALPMVVPLTLGLFIKNTPSWAAWSTALAGLTTASCAKWWIGPSLYARLAGVSVESLRPQEVVDISFATTVVLVTLVGSAWYCLTMRFAPRETTPYKEEVEAFFKDMKTPVDPAAENIVYDDGRQYHMIGKLCIVYGGAMLFGMLIPNAAAGRLCFLFVGVCMLAVGGLLYANYRRNRVAPLGQASAENSAPSLSESPTHE